MWEYRANLTPGYAVGVNVHDADTVRLLVDNGFGARADVQLRLADVSAPELNEVGGPEARAFTVEWMQRATNNVRRWPLRIITEQTSSTEPTERRSFLRYIGIVYEINTGGCLNADLKHFLAQHPDWPSGKEL